MAGEKILIVEDNSMNLELATDLLEAAGYFVIQAGSAEEGLKLARADSPDLILMDIGLPGMDGLEATGVLKQDLAITDIPVIALTAHAMQGDEEKALASGCAGYITKPIDTRTFSKTVSQFIDSARRLTGIKILIVDDLEINLELLEARLE
ncbi:MAG: response regulator, partial [Deltaproteobacteria bacterium]|nr:response regulator [Deltaproteobacteria bacterium]